MNNVDYETSFKAFMNFAKGNLTTTLVFNQTIQHEGGIMMTNVFIFQNVSIMKDCRKCNTREDDVV